MEISPLIISLKTGAVAIGVTFFLGIWAARGVMGIRNQGIKTLLDCLVTLPMVLPPTVAGLFLLIIFGVNRPFGKFLLEVFGLIIPFTWKATVIAAVVISFPLMYRSARGAFEQVDEELLQAARTLGMKERSIFFKVLLPLSMPGVASGGILAFARGIGEFGATAMIAGNILGKTRTLSLAVYSSVSAGDFEGAYKYALVLAVLSFMSVTLINIIALGRRRFWVRVKT